MEELEIIPEASTSQIPTPLPKLLPDPLNAPKRADLLNLKLKLASLLSPEDGLLYWNNLVKFLTGKINREELGLILKLVLGENAEAVQVHNALLLSILYNTTRPYLPPASLRHSGWHKRRRDKDGSKLEDRDPKRRKIKAQVMALGKRERAEIKSLAIVKKDAELAIKELEYTITGKGLLRASLDSKGGKVGKDGIPLALKDIKTPSTLEQDYARCLQAPLCCESKMLPDIDTLKDRMSLTCYDSGLGEGVDSKVAALALLAIDTHLKSMVTSVIALIRSNRANGIRTTSQSALNLLSTSKPLLPTASTSTSSHPKILISNGNTTVPLESLQRSPESISDNEDDDPYLYSPLTAGDFSSLFEISPHLLAREHLGVIEKLYAIPPPYSDSDSSSGSSDEDGDDEGEPSTSGNGKNVPSRSNSRSSRSGARSNSTGGREQYLIDPSAIAIPPGHPDVTHTHPTLGSLSLPASNNNIPSNSGNNPSIRLVSRKTSLNNFAIKNGTPTSPQIPLQSIPLATSTSTPTSSINLNGTRSLSPTSASLRAQLFPELDNPSSASTSTTGGGGMKLDPSGIQSRLNSRRSSSKINGSGGVPQSPNFTSSDGGSDSDDNNNNNNTPTSANSNVSTLVKLPLAVGVVPDGTINGLGRNPVRSSISSSAGGLVGVGSNSLVGVGPNGLTSGTPVVGGRKLWEVVDSHRLMNGLLD